MLVTAEKVIGAPREMVWKAITDIENSQNIISGIKGINVLDQPTGGVVGLQWEETREMFGREATETMWITEAEEGEYYQTRAESHGSIYITRVSLRDTEDGTILTMTFTGITESLVAKLMSFLMGPFIKRSLHQALMKDLDDIKAHLEK